LGGFALKTSARNVYEGAVLSVHHGAVNDEIEVVLKDSDTRLVSVITSTSAKSLGLEHGKKVVALFKAPWVILITEAEGVRFSARNQLAGTVVSIKEGTVDAEVRVRLDGGEGLTAVITMESLKNLGIESGKRVTALVKASHVIIGVKE
jgi:molybdate transport system regulatory protein